MLIKDAGISRDGLDDQPVIGGAVEEQVGNFEKQLPIQQGVRMLPAAVFTKKLSMYLALKY